jgi:thiamine-phosphate pyrophosphorylase
VRVTLYTLALLFLDPASGFMPSNFRLCYITDRRALEPTPLLAFIRKAILAGVDMIQVREKDLGTRPLAELVKPAIESASGADARVLVNDRLDIALALGAAGVHLGTQSLPARAVRPRVPADFLIGVSCHSLEDALAAESAGADYMLLGPVFATPSKLGYGSPLGIEILREAAKRVRVPVLALGGMTVERVRPCLEAGATGIAGISIFQACDSLDERIKELRAQFDLA